jgi:Alr-MurF fusion protein
MEGKYTIHHICDWLNAQCNFAFPNEEIHRLSIDSRNLYEAKNTLFIAIKGDNHNGHNYIPQLIEAGVKNFLISESRYAQLYEANFILVPNTLDALQKIAAQHRAQFNIPVVGITGSLGKTVIKEWLAHMLDSSEKVVRSPRSYNSQVGVPLSVWQMQAEHSIALFEAGISMPGEMAKLKEIIEPNIGVFSNLGDPHSENFESHKHKAIEKAQLFTDCKSIVYCADNNTIAEVLELICPQAQKITWGNTAQASMCIVSKTMSFDLCEIELLWNDEKLFFTIPFSDTASIENACHCIALLLHLGKTQNQIQMGLTKLNPVAMRLEMKRGMHNALLINDVYTSDLASLEIALDVLHRQQKQGEKTLILSDILQSDKSENELYRELGLLLKRYNIQHFIGIGKALERNESHIQIADARFYESTQACLRNLHQHSFRNQAILLKGARPFQLEKISQRLEERLHETRLEIDLNAVVHNLNYYRSLLSKETKIMAVIKASSYGSGGIEMASLLQHQRIDYLAVAFADEGIETA